MRFFGLFLLTFLSLSVKAQVVRVNVSGILINQMNRQALPYIPVVMESYSDSDFYAVVVSNPNGLFVFNNIVPGQYKLSVFHQDFLSKTQNIYIGSSSEFIDLSTIELIPDSNSMSKKDTTSFSDFKLSRKKPEMVFTPDKKVISVSNLVSQSGGTVLQMLQNLPGVTILDGKVFLRGSDKVMILIDGKQNALTGFGAQSGLDNIPASSVERIEIINNPSSKYDANGNAGIINIILKKNSKDGWSGKFGLSVGAGALWIKHENLPNIRPQYRFTPKINPSLALYYRKKKMNFYLQSDYLYKPTLNKNEFITRTYDSGKVISQQTKRNRNTSVYTGRLGADWNISEKSVISTSALISRERILDNGDEPFFNQDLSERYRLWQFLEDEIKTTATFSSVFVHKFDQPGHTISAAYNYTYHRENERYFFTNILPVYTDFDSFKLLSTEHVNDITFDYSKPLKYGKLEAGLKYRYRYIPTSMIFKPGLHTTFDLNAGGWANYKEQVPAVYGNYLLDKDKFEAQIGLRIEFVKVNYQVDPNHNTFKSDGYNYFKPFPNFKLAYKLNQNSKLGFSFGKRVDRPSEFDLRVFPKYDDAEIIKIGNPSLKPQYSNNYELNFTNNFKKGYFTSAVYNRSSIGTITRIATVQTGSTIVYNQMQNAGKSQVTGLELVYSRRINSWANMNVMFNAYRNHIDQFTTYNLYPSKSVTTFDAETVFSGNLKSNIFIRCNNTTEIQLSAAYLAPDIIPQGKIGKRFSLDAGIKRQLKGKKGELFMNASDLFNTMVVKQTIYGKGFTLQSSDYFETQVIRFGYQYKF